MILLASDRASYTCILEAWTMSIIGSSHCNSLLRLLKSGIDTWWNSRATSVRGLVKVSCSLELITPANPFFPRWVILLVSTLRPWLEDDLGSPFWNALILESSLDKIHAASWIFLRRGWRGALWGSIRTSWHFGKRRRHSTGRLSTIGNHTCVVHTGAMQAWSWRTFGNTPN